MLALVCFRAERVARPVPAMLCRAVGLAALPSHAEYFHVIPRKTETFVAVLLEGSQKEGAEFIRLEHFHVIPRKTVTFVAVLLEGSQKDRCRVHLPCSRVLSRHLAEDTDLHDVR